MYYSSRISTSGRFPSVIFYTRIKDQYVTRTKHQKGCSRRSNEVVTQHAILLSMDQRNANFFPSTPSIAHCDSTCHPIHLTYLSTTTFFNYARARFRKASEEFLMGLWSRTLKNNRIPDTYYFYHSPSGWVCIPAVATYICLNCSNQDD